MFVNFHFRKYIQSNPVNTDTEGAKESIRINGVSVLSGSCYENKKDPFYRYKYTLGARAFSSAVSGFCQVFIVTRAASAYGRRCVSLRPTPRIPAAREKNLWYPG